MKKQFFSSTLTILTAVVCICFLFLTTATVSSADKPFAGETLVVGIWSGPYADHFKEAIGEPFEEMTGAELQYKYSWDFTPEIIAAPEDQPPLDVAETADADYLVGVKRELWLPLRYENIPNIDNVYPYVKNEMSPTIEYGVPFDVGMHILLYRKDLVEQAPQSWEDLFRDEFKGKIGIERWFPYWVYVGSYLTDYSPPEEAIYSQEGRDAILEQMGRLSKRWFFCYEKGAEFVSALDAGEILVGNYWNGSGTTLILENQDRYGIVFPEEGGVAYLDHFCVVRGTEKRDLAEAFINYTVGKKAQIDFLKRHYNIMVYKDLEGQIPEVMKKNDLQPTTVQAWKKITNIDAEFLEPMRQELEDRFLKEVLSR